MGEGVLDVEGVNWWWSGSGAALSVLQRLRRSAEKVQSPKTTDASAAGGQIVQR